METINKNLVKINGSVATEPCLSHELYKESFYLVYVNTERRSGTMDTLPVIVSERSIDINSLMVGTVVNIVGKFSSYSKNIDGKRKLIVNIFAKDIGTTNVLFNENSIELDGFITKKPVYRKTLSGREITDLLIAVNRKYGKTDYIPTIAWGRNARYISDFPIGTHVNLTGRIQSREYMKRFKDGSEELRVAYEVSAGQIEVLEGDESEW